MMRAGTNHDIEEIGMRSPEMIKVDQLGPGEVGYVVAGIRDVAGAKSGETITEATRPAKEALEGYLDPKPMVFCGIYPIDGDDLTDLRDALDKLKLNDASITFEPEKSPRARFRFPLRLLRSVAHGDCSRATRSGSSISALSPRPHRWSTARS